MKRLLIFGSIVAAFGLYLSNMDFDGRDRRISVVEEQIPADGVMGRVTRVMEGQEGIYYRYEYPQYVIDEKFSMKDITDEITDRVVDYEKSGDEEYLVEIQGADRGIVLHRGRGEVCLTVADVRNIGAVEAALKKNGLLEEKVGEKLELLKTELNKIV